MNDNRLNVTEVTFLGTAAVVPEALGDTASFVVNGRMLVDCGWNAAINMKRFGLDPLVIEYLFLTHCHHDHYIGLPQLLFYHAIRAAERSGRPALKIVGPEEDVQRVTDLALAFLQADQFGGGLQQPEVIPVRPGDRVDGPGFTLDIGRSIHPVPALCCRYTDSATGGVLAFTGDTAYSAEVIRHVEGADLLVHEASFGPRAAPERNTYLHAGAPDAAKVALEAGVGRLALVHGALEARAEAVAAAQAIFPRTFWPADGERVPVVKEPRTDVS